MPIYDELRAKSCDGYLSGYADPFGEHDRSKRIGRYVSEFSFITQYAEVTGGPILELACGAGRVIMALARLGFDVYGIDASQPMLMRGQSAVAKLPLPQQERIHFIRGDMRSFSLQREFPLIIVPFNSFWLNLDEQGATACLSSLLGHLEPHGFFLIESAIYHLGHDIFFTSLKKKLNFEFTTRRYSNYSPNEMLMGWKPSSSEWY